MTPGVFRKLRPGISALDEPSRRAQQREAGVAKPHDCRIWICGVPSRSALLAKRAPWAITQSCHVQSSPPFIARIRAARSCASLRQATSGSFSSFLRSPGF